MTYSTVNIFSSSLAKPIGVVYEWVTADVRSAITLDGSESDSWSYNMSSTSKLLNVTWPLFLTVIVYTSLSPTPISPSLFKSCCATSLKTLMDFTADNMVMVLLSWFKSGS